MHKKEHEGITNIGLKKKNSDKRKKKLFQKVKYVKKNGTHIAINYGKQAAKFNGEKCEDIA